MCLCTFSDLKPLLCCGREWSGEGFFSLFFSFLFFFFGGGGEGRERERGVLFLVKDYVYGLQSHVETEGET